jgi:SAM-dependent methyltransferase
MKCPICQAGAEFRFAQGAYRIFECEECGFGWPDPLPTAEDLDRFYSTYTRVHLSDSKINRPEHLRIATTLRQLSPGGRTLLDVGCGYGQFLDAAREQGFQTFGLDVNPTRVNHAAARGHQVSQEMLTAASFGGRKFDVVVLSHVIEHLRDPKSLLQTIHEVLVPKGMLYIGCPNFGGLHATLAHSRYHHYCPPEHIAFFSAESLRRCAAGAGFGPVQMRFFTHILQAKELLAHFAYLRFARPPRNQDAARSDGPGAPFVSGSGRFVKAPIYRLVLGISWLLRPVINILGGDNIESYWRRVAV